MYTEKDNERAYQRKFIEYMKTADPANLFIEEISINHEMKIRKSRKSIYIPDYRLDLIQIDEKLNFHLWETKFFDSDELIRGKILGQIVFYDNLFSGSTKDYLLKVLNKKNLGSSVIEKLTDREQEVFRFKSWNILACGGQGWEMAEGVSPVMCEYSLLKKRYFRDDLPELQVYHFYKVSTGYDLRNIQQLSIYHPHSNCMENLTNLGIKCPDVGIHPEAYQAFWKTCTEEERKQIETIQSALKRGIEY